MKPIELGPDLDTLWALYADDIEALNARIPFPDWVRQLHRKQDEERRRDATSGPEASA